MSPDPAFLTRAEELAAEGWARIATGRFWRHVLSEGFDRQLYVGLMGEIRHYTRHNAQNQALAARRVFSDRLGLLRFCLRHALEEAGHDLFVSNDLRSIGVEPHELRQRPLPETEAFVAYIYRVATERDATARLGYSFWAESCYPFIADVLAAMRTSLGLEERQMTFFVAHSDIDERHFQEVRDVAAEWCRDEALQADFLDVLEHSLHLQGQMLEGVYRAWASAPQPVA
ncbi:MAG: iron-containing redox enzyme family protein [Planctomycetota bacterium]